MDVNKLKDIRNQKLPNTISNSFMRNKIIEIPKLCPKCGVSNNPVFKIEGVQGISDGDLAYISCRCLACEHWTFLIVKAASRNDEEKKPWNLLAQFPNNSVRSFDPLIQKCSPRFVDLYNSAFDAEQNGHLDLAGMGYRASLEVLIKDWALQYSGESKDTISKYNLNNAISHFLQNDVAAFASSDVVREFGNDFTHWDRPDNFEAISYLSVIKTYMDIFINSVLIRLQISNPPAGRAHHSDSNNN